MRHTRLGRSGLTVSVVGLGCNNLGRPGTATLEQAGTDDVVHAALDAGITFFDVADVYGAEPGLSEERLGRALGARRDEVVIGTKFGMDMGGVAGDDGGARGSRRYIVRAVEDSLRRLGTDWIDLYQFHTPDPATPIEETLRALDELVRSGKIRHVGLSNETPWGTMAFLRLADELGLPRVVSVQNAYNLLNRTYEDGLAEVSVREQCGLLAYSPLAAATLTGKYLDGRIPPGTRRALDHRKSRYDKVNADAAVRAYLEVAKRHGLDPAQMALAFVTRQPFVTSNIIGATSMEHLKTNIDSIGITLTEAVLKEIEEVNDRFPNPCP